jgi:CRISPR-associated exonuclease Cas4
MKLTRLIPISALQHHVFCPRQCALIHNEQQWAENFLTAQGQLLHQRVDSKEPETRRGIRYERGVSVAAPLLRLTGKLDLLEIELASGKLTPVEYKRGRPKKSDCDAIQLCAQALCLEEMTDQCISHGSLWYGQTRHRQEISLDKALRHRTQQVIDEVARLLDSGQTPKARYTKACDACSLNEICQPKLLAHDHSYAYVLKLFHPDE